MTTTGSKFECSTCGYLHHYCTCGTVSRHVAPMTAAEARRVIEAAFPGQVEAIYEQASR